MKQTCKHKGVFFQLQQQQQQHATTVNCELHCDKSQKSKSLVRVVFPSGNWCLDHG